MDENNTYHHIDHPENEEMFQSLNVNKGIPQPPTVNPHLGKYRKARRKYIGTSEYVEGILKGNITLLSQAVTLVESNLSDHYQQAQEIIEKCLPYTGKSVRIGITGVPGAGKSTFIEALGMHIVRQGGKLAVLAIDPSSERTKGSILGDKTRMEELSGQAGAYIRPSPSAGTLGGVARKTRESIILCEAAGFNTIFVETVGVGQSETAVHSMVDFFLLLMLAGAGDELQGIKRGIMEMADGIAINKADGDNLNRAKRAQGEYRNALHLFPPTDSKWEPKVLTCSSIDKTGIEDVWQMISDYMHFTEENGYFTEKRKSQARYWMYESVNEWMKYEFYQNTIIRQAMTRQEDLVLNARKSSFVAAKELFELYINQLKQK